MIECTSTNAFTRSSPCYCTISCIYAAACAATAVAVCRTIIKRPLGVFSSPLRNASQPASPPASSVQQRNLGHYQSKKSPQTKAHTCWQPIGCVYYDYDYVIGQIRCLMLVGCCLSANCSPQSPAHLAAHLLSINIAKVII